MIGQLVGHYKVVRKIGDGGMGSVFEAVHEGIGRHVAIKVLRPQYSKDSLIVTRFFNEARAVNIVTHPGIVGSFDYGQLPDGTAYIVMEYCDGESLSGRIKRLRGPFGPDALRIGRQIAAALAAAHGKGIVHRDLKPDNVIIVADAEAPGGERAKVLDFGIAKIIGDQGAGANNGLTQMGAVMGTPRYMSPEQCKGSGNVDGKTDVYALGVLMFIMLTGKAPFDAEGTGALMAMHIYQPPPNLSEIEPMVSPPAEALVLQMLAKDPTERPSMLEIVAQLERIGAFATQALPVVHRVSLSHQQLAPVQAQIGTDPSGPTSSSRPSLAAVGQTQDPTSIKSGTTRLKRLLIPVAMATVLSAIGITVVLRQWDSDPEHPKHHAAASSRRVTWEVKSTPPGVEVIRIADGAVLGKTPWRQEEPAGTGKVGITLRQTGYMDKQVLLDKTKNCSEDIQLDLVPTGDERPASEGSDRGGTRPTKKPGRTKKIKEAQKNDDLDLAPLH